jgi:hypothetical protein
LLAQLSDIKWFKTLVDRNNDPEDDPSFNMCSAFAIGRVFSMQHWILFTSILPRFGFYPKLFAKSPPDGFFS